MLTVVDAEKNEVWKRLSMVRSLLLAALSQMPELDGIGDPELTLDIARAHNTACEVMANVELDLEQGRSVTLDEEDEDRIIDAVNFPSSLPWGWDEQDPGYAPEDSGPRIVE